VVPARVAPVVLAGALTVGLVVSCSAEAGPRAAPTPSVTSPATTSTEPTPDASPKPDPVEPRLPAAAKANTRAGAEAFVRYYIDLLNYAANTGDTRALRAAAARCPGCSDYAALYEKTYEAGGYFRDPGWRPFSVLSRLEGDAWTVLVQVKAPAVTYVKKAGAKPRRGERDVYALRFEVTRQHDAWSVTSFTGE